MSDTVIARVGQCIYCRETRPSLSDEHPIPYGLDGQWVLKAASCPKCARITSAIETYVLRTHLIKARTILNMRTRRKKQRPREFPVYFKTEAGFQPQQIPAADQPILLLLPLYDLPAHISGRPYTRSIRLSGGDVVQVGGRPLKEFRLELKRNNVSAAELRGRFDPHIFARFLAKIAHGFAVAHLGLDNFDSYVVPAILREADDVGRWVGCDLAQPPTGEPRVPHIVHARVAKSGEITIRVNLFAYIRTQEYIVIAGRKRL